MESTLVLLASSMLQRACAWFLRIREALELYVPFSLCLVTIYQSLIIYG